MENKIKTLELMLDDAIGLSKDIGKTVKQYIALTAIGALPIRVRRNLQKRIKDDKSLQQKAESLLGTKKPDLLNKAGEYNANFEEAMYVGLPVLYTFMKGFENNGLAGGITYATFAFCIATIPAVFMYMGRDEATEQYHDPHWLGSPYVAIPYHFARGIKKTVLSITAIANDTKENLVKMFHLTKNYIQEKQD